MFTVVIQPHPYTGLSFTLTKQYDLSNFLGKPNILPPQRYDTSPLPPTIKGQILGRSYGAGAAAAMSNDAHARPIVSKCQWPIISFQPIPITLGNKKMMST